MNTVNVEQAIRRVDSIAEAEMSEEKGYVIDLFPKPVHHERFSELEDFFLETYMAEAGAKVTRIMIKLIHYYDAVIYLAELPEGNRETPYASMTFQNLRNLPLRQLVEIIQYVVTHSGVTMVFYFPVADAFIDISGGDWFQISVLGFDANKEALTLLKLLVEREGLFLR